MKAARWYQARDIRIDDIEEPTVSAGKVKIKVAWTGICGSDLHEYLAGPIFVPVDKSHKISGDIAPIVMGHEFSGEVVEVGSGVTKFKAGDKAVVFGAGPIGLLVIEALRAAGAAEIYAVELSPQRSEKARELGARLVIDPSKEDAVARIRELTNGGVDVSFEVTGVPVVLKQCIDSTRYEGETIIVSIWEGEASFHPNKVVLAERNIKGIIAYRHIFPAVMDLMTQGYCQADKLVTKRIDLADLVDEGFDALVKEKQQVKVLVRPPQ